MSDFPCYFLDYTNRLQESLRRFRFDNGICPVNGYHNASVNLGIVESVGHLENAKTQEPAHDDPRWPAACSCGYVFLETDEWQINADRLYRRSDTGEEVQLRDAAPGGLYDAPWLADFGYAPHPDDGMILHCVTPEGPWNIDGHASNCTRKDDKEHRCWCRHGTVPNIHVDKIGNTCEAGAGSILIGPYHGFLHNGHLVSC